MKWRKSLFAIVCALLVASSCFFLAFSTNAWADTGSSTTSDYFCTLFAVPSTYDPAHHGSPIYIPNATTTGAWKSSKVANDWTGYFPLVVQSNVFKPVDHDVYIYVALGVDSDASVESQGTDSRFSKLYYQKYLEGYTDPPFSVDDAVYYRAYVTTNKHGKAGLFRIKVPANCTEFHFNTPLKFRYKGAALVSCYGAWVVDPQHYDTFEQMVDILQSIDAELDTQTQILTAVSNRLSSIDSTVTNIEKLLSNPLYCVGYTSTSDGTSFNIKYISYDTMQNLIARLNTDFIGHEISVYRRDSFDIISTRTIVGASVKNIRIGDICALSYQNSDGTYVNFYLCDVYKNIYVVDPTSNYGLNIYQLLKDSLATEGQHLSNESRAVAEKIMMREDSEQYWSDKNTENYQAIGLDNFSFSSGIVSGITLVGTIFTNLWNSLGEYTVIFIFSLTLGIALVVIGRVSRTGGKKGGDDG